MVLKNMLVKKTAAQFWSQNLSLFSYLKDCSLYLGGAAISHPSDPSRCYGIANRQALNYQDAVDYCTAKGGGWGPVNIEDVEENDLLFKTFTTNSPGR